MSEAGRKIDLNDDDKRKQDKDDANVDASSVASPTLTVTTISLGKEASFLESSHGITSAVERRVVAPTETSFYVNTTKYSAYELLLLKEYINVYKKHISQIWLCLSHDPLPEVFLVQKTSFFSKSLDVSACVGRMAKFKDDVLSFPLYAKRERKKVRFALTPINAKMYEHAVASTDELKSVFNNEGASKRELITDTSYCKWYPMSNLERVVGSQKALLPAYIADALPNYQPKPLSDVLVKHILLQLGKSVVSLHAEGLFHGCICPSLVYMSPDFNIMTMEMGRIQAQWHDSIRWRSPELTELCNNFSPDDRSSLHISADGLRKKQASDVWAFGCMAMYLSTALIPFPEERDPLSILTQLQALIYSKERKALGTPAEIYSSDNCTYCSLETLLNVDKISNKLIRDVVSQCLALNYKKRPTLQTIMNMPLFTNDQVGNISSETTYGSILRSINIDIRTQNVNALEPKSDEALALAACFSTPTLGEVAMSVLTKSGFVMRNVSAYAVTMERGSQQEYDRSSTTASIASTEPDAPEVKMLLAPHLPYATPPSCTEFKLAVYSSENDDAMRRAVVVTLQSIAARYHGPSKHIYLGVETLVDALKSQTRTGRLREREESVRRSEDSAFSDEELLHPSDRHAAEGRHSGIDVYSSDNEENVIESDMLNLHGNCFREVATHSVLPAFTAEEIVPKSTMAKRLLVGKTRFIVLGVSIGMFVVVIIVVVLLAVLLTRK